LEFCSYCKTKIEHKDEHCLSCGIPLYANEEEKSRFITHIHRTREKYQEAYAALQRAKWILVIIGLGSILINFYSFYLGKIDEGDLLMYSALGIFLVLAGFLTLEHPIPSVTMGIIFIVGIYAYSVYQQPLNLMNKIILKVLVLASLVYALKTAIEFERMTGD